jgi:hypothetical protein|tara:strand:+ start:1400 stop:1855 length:456 start_codon:yes stop_codon:yes gene_type:complete
MAKKASTGIKAKSIFEHLSGIKEKKTSWESLTDMDKKSFSPFIINRWLSMNMDLLPIVNILQKYTIGLLSARDTYKVYLDFLPNKKTFDKYIKGKSDGKYNKDMLKYLSTWYGVSQREVIDYMELLPKQEVLDILMKYGLTDKEAKKLLKK